MHDIRRICENPDAAKQSLARRNPELTTEIDRLILFNANRREILSEVETLKARQNQASKEIAFLKKNEQSVERLLIEMKVIAGALPELERRLRVVNEEIESIMLGLPNAPAEDVPDGVNSDQNTELRQWGTPRTFDFDPKPHWEIGANLKILNPTAAGKVTGARFHFYRGLGARLERSVVNFFLNQHTAKDYTEIFPPFMVNRAAMTGTGQLPKFEDNAFKVAGTDYFLIPTAEVPVTNMHREEVLADLPYKYCAYSACFREEAGAAGRDTRGLIRQHQFNKVELVMFAKPEQSAELLETLTHDAESLLQVLGIPYRVVCLCTGDLGFSSSKTYDIEVWMPSYNRYVEISSCSNFLDFQARRAGIRFRGDDGKLHFVHTLNGSGLAVGRTVAAILENFQNADGSVTIPEALRGLMGTETMNS